MLIVITITIMIITRRRKAGPAAAGQYAPPFAPWQGPSEANKGTLTLRMIPLMIYKKGHIYI